MQNTILLSQHISLPGANNVLVVGGPASGKTHSYVLPNLLQCNGSYVIVDTGREMLRKTRKMFEKDGYEIKVIDLQKAGIESINLDDVAEIGRQKTVVFVIPSWDNATNETVFPILISKIYEEIAPDAELPIHLFLDEFANLGYIPKIGQYMAEDQDKVSCFIIVQSTAQLGALYGENWDKIVLSCNAILCFGRNDIATNEFFSAIVGKQMSRCMDKHECLVVINGQRPMVNSKYNPKMHPRYGEIEK